jgi:hypothetical protein
MSDSWPWIQRRYVLSKRPYTITQTHGATVKKGLLQYQNRFANTQFSAVWFPVSAAVTFPATLVRFRLIL